MADIFISYAREDIKTAERLAVALEAHGWSVFWDRRIPAGRRFAEFIDEQLKAVKCVITLWSHASIASDWVREEAEYARKRNILVPALIERVEPPWGFRLIQAADLVDWQGEEGHQGLRQLLHDIKPYLTTATPVPKEEPLEPTHQEAAARAEADRAGREKAEQERLEQERTEQERLRREKAVAERQEAERVAGERAEKDRLERERREAAARAEAERIAAAKAEQKRLEDEEPGQQGQVQEESSDELQLAATPEPDRMVRKDPKPLQQAQVQEEAEPEPPLVEILARHPNMFWQLGGKPLTQSEAAPGDDGAEMAEREEREAEPRMEAELDERVAMVTLKVVLTVGLFAGMAFVFWILFRG